MKILRGIELPNLVQEALSHFSWQLTNGCFMIMDHTNVLDPTFFSADMIRFTDEKNEGMNGIIKFFNRHVCNRLCGILDLVHPQNTQQISHTHQFYETQTFTNVDLNKINPN
jgi:hypothetical protein